MFTVAFAGIVIVSVSYITLLSEQKNLEQVEEEAITISPEEMNYQSSKLLAKETAEIFAIRGVEEYSALREKFRPKMKDATWEEYFGKELSYPKRNITSEVKEILGEVRGRNAFMFKVKASVTYKNNMDITYLVLIDNGVVQDITVL